MMKDNHGLVSAIMPVYNGDRYLSEAIESVLAQTEHNIEIIVIDDGSTDNTGKIAQSYKDNISYMYQSNSGAPSARNRGLEMARGEFIAFLDADDLWSKNKLELQLGYLSQDPSIEIVLGYQQIMQLIGVKDENNTFENIAYPSMTLQLGAGLFRKSAFEKVGKFNPELRYADDWDWFMRGRELGISMRMYPETVLFYRRHDRNLTNHKELDNHYTIRMLKKSLDRRRQQNHGLATSLPNLSECQAESTELDPNQNYN